MNNALIVQLTMVRLYLTDMTASQTELLILAKSNAICPKNYLLYKDGTILLYQNSSSQWFCCSFQHFVGLLSDLTGLLQGFFFGLLQPSYCCYLVVLFCSAFHRAPLILNASFWVFSYTSTHVPALLVILVFLVFPTAPLFLVCCLGHSPYVSQTVAG